MDPVESVLPAAVFLDGGAEEHRRGGVPTQPTVAVFEGVS
ncbi:hypothetical protein L618_000100000010, partial [Rhodococcus rhodochrous J45]